MINNAKKSASVDSAYGYIEAIEFNNSMAQMDNKKYTLINDGTDIDINTIGNIGIKGTTPESGKISITKGKITKATLCINSYNVEYDGKEAKVKGKCDSNNIIDKIYKCKRATSLHTEECSRTSNYCYSAGYTNSGSKKTTTITYGNDLETIVKGTLTSGVGFDCDVNGDKIFYSTTERFYYVGDLSSNSNYALLIYYNNTTKNVDSNTIAYYADSNENWHGPLTAITNLPTKEEWNNINLINNKRKLINNRDEDKTTGGNLPIDFDYSNYVARLITYQEIISACGSGDPKKAGYLDSCNYLLENTFFSTADLNSYGFWLETPSSSNSSTAWYLTSYDRSIYTHSNYPTTKSDSFGVRPLIEVLKENIDY